MKRLLFMSMVLCATAATAQEEKSVALDEVTVKGSHTVQKVDGQWIYPTRQQLDASTSGYALLARLALPHIRVDEAMNSITALTNLGSVQVRINDMVASREDLLALDLQAVDHVEFIDNPGVRYGEGVAYVIDIKVKRPVGGHVVGSQLTNTLTAWNGDESVYAKVNHGRSELGLSYALDYHDFKGAEYDELSAYVLESGDVATMHRQSQRQRSRSLGHNAQLTYSLSDSSYVLQARLGGKADIRPRRSDAVILLDGTPYDDRSATRSSSPSLDVYFHQDFRRHQSLTANAVGTYIKTTGSTENNEGAPYRYHTTGKTHSLWGESLYENRLKPFTLTAGVQLSQRHSHNVYEGDVAATNNMHTSDVYLFSQLKGTLARLSYTGGLGVSRRHYRQGAAQHDFWLCRPKVSASYPLADHLKLSYDFEVGQHVSQIALVSDVSIKQNAMETILGNPHIRPNRVTSHRVALSYTSPRLTSEVQGYYRINSHCNMERYLRRDGHFYQTQTNADNECSFFYVDTYNQWDIVPERLVATVYGGVYRFFNFGEGYRHTYTALNGGGSLQAYLGAWTLGAYADNGWNFMEGEHRGHQAPAWYFVASCRMNSRLTLSLFGQHLLAQHPLTNKTEVVSRYVGKTVTQHYRDYGNMVTVKLSYRLDRGRKYRDIQRTMNHSDSETGILSK